MKNLIIGIFLIAIATTSKADFNQAVKDYETGNYKAALTEFQSLAEIGNKSAQYNLGFMYLDGLGTKQDLAKAYAWIKLSNEVDNSKESHGVLNQIEKYLDGDTKLNASKFYEQYLADYGNSSIVSDLEPIFDVNEKGDAKLFAKPIKTSPAKYPYRANINGLEGFVKLEFTLDKNGSPMNTRVINSYPKGIFEKNTLAAIKHWKFEKNNSNEPVRYTMEFQLNGGGKGFNKPRYKNKVINQINKIEEKAKAGDAVAEYYYGVYGPNFKPELNINATEWFYKSAQKGISDAQYELGLNLINGQGCKSDKVKGIKWLIKSASGDLGRSQFELARLYRQKGKDYDIEKSNFWLDKAIEAKDKVIAFELAQYLLINTDFDANRVKNLLSTIEKKDVYDVVSYYEVHALLNSKLGNHSESVSKQNKANIMVKKITGKTPQYMKDKKAYYKSLENS